MTTPYTYSDEELFESFSPFEGDEGDDLDERSRPGQGRPRPVPVSNGKSAFRPSPSRSYVTEAQLRAALERVGQQIRTNSAAIKTLEGRAASLATEQGRLGTALRKEGETRKKDLEAVRKELQETRELTAILPLLTAGNSAFAKIAPLLLLTGGSSSGGSGGLLGGNALVTALLFSTLAPQPTAPAGK